MKSTLFTSVLLTSFWLSGTALAQPAALMPSPSLAILGLDEAVTIALATSPDARRASAMLEQARGMLLTAGTRPNPELGVDVENVGGNAPNKGFDSAELTYSLSQKIEIGGKRNARLKTAEAEGALAQLDSEGIQRDVAYAVKIAYMEALAAERRRDDARYQVKWAEKTLNGTSRLYRSGGESAAQVAKGEALLEQARLALAQAEIDTQATRQQFAALLGKAEVMEALEKTALDYLAPLPVAITSSTAPALQRAQLEINRAESSLRQQRSLALPDPSVGVGVRQFRENDSNALVFNVSMPIPLFDRNRGEIIRANAQLVTAEADAAKTELTFRNRQSLLHQTLNKHRKSAELLKAKVIPAAEKALLDLGRGYEQGRNTLLDVQDSARTLQESRQQLVEAQLGYQQTHAELERDLALSATVTFPTLSPSSSIPTGDSQ